MEKYRWERRFYQAGSLADEWTNMDAAEGNPFTLSNLDEKSCLVLLGEPGLGKTTVMEKSFNITIQSGKRAIFLKLGMISNQETIYRELLLNNEVLGWKDSGGELTIYLDGLDECIAANGYTAIFLFEKLKSLPRSGLRLRISCRSIDWTPYFEKELKTLWNDQQIGVFVLAPLSIMDIRAAAESEGLNSDYFIKLLKKNGLYSLASYPISLNFLISAAKRSEFVPRNRMTLFESGCKSLCTESNPQRKVAKLVGKLTPSQRFIIASRIAALTIFSNKRIICEEISFPKESISVSELSGGKEHLDGIDIEVTEEAIRESLSTGLFIAQGSSMIIWAHPTYPEFLATWYMIKHRVSFIQLESLIRTSDGHIVPQLRGVAVWLAMQNPFIMDSILNNEPETLLVRDNGSWSDEETEKITENLLSVFDRDGFHRTIPGEQLKTLNYSLLGQQLVSWISDSNSTERAITIAIEIANACEIKDVGQAILHIALDPSKSWVLRSHAGYYLIRYGDGETIGKLRPLVTESNLDDPHDELKAIGLRAIWPERITIEELLPLLTPPKSDVLGPYDVFLSRDLAKGLKERDFPFALNWSAKNDANEEWKQRLIDSIIIKAFEWTQVPEIGDPLSSLVLQRLKQHVSILAHPIGVRLQDKINEDERRSLVRHLVRKMSLDDVNHLLFSADPLMTTSDIEWAIVQLSKATIHAERIVWAELIIRAFRPSNENQLRAIRHSAKQNDELMKAFLRYYGPIELNSKKAEEARAEYNKLNELIDQEELTNEEPPLDERIKQCLQSFESGNIDMWWVLNRIITPRGEEFEADLTVFPGWGKAEDIERQRMVVAAKRYLMEYNLNDLTWFGESKYYFPAIAGHRALLLIQKIDPDWVAGFPNERWKKWLPAILDCPLTRTEKRESDHLLMIRKEYEVNKELFLEQFNALILKESRASDYPFLIDRIESFIDSIIADNLLTLAGIKEIKPTYLKELLVILLKHQPTTAQELGLIILDERTVSRERALAATVAMMHATSQVTWPRIWTTLEEEEAFGREAIVMLFASCYFENWLNLSVLNDAQIADFYIWLSRQYPPKDDPQMNGFMTPRHNIAEFRNALIRVLVNRGSSAACEALAYIQEELPEQDWLGWAVSDAQENARKKEWRPLQSKQILSLVSDSEYRYIRNADDLIVAVVESLKRLEDKLHGDTPSAYDLWNEFSEDHYKKYSPKDENSLSDYVKRHLDSDLRTVIVGRETEIRSGEKTDIHVDAVISREDGFSEKLSLIVETKGCWNDGLETDLKTQLVDRYLEENKCRHGIYLVGWYRCPAWTPEDYRYNKNAKYKSIKELNDFLENLVKNYNKDGLTVAIFVLDVTIRQRPKRKATKQ